MQLRFYIGILLSSAFLGIALYRVDFYEFKRAMEGADHAFLLLAMMLTLVVCVIRSVRWNYLFGPLKKIRLRSLFSVIMVGFLANNILPARLGDVTMVCLIGEKEDISKSSALAIIFIDRFLDFSTLFCFLVMSLHYKSFPFWVHRLSQFSLVLFFAVVACLILIFKHKDSFLYLLDKWLPSKFARSFVGIIGNVIKGLEVLKNLRVLVLSIFLSLLIWTSLGLGVYLLTKSYHLNLSFQTAFFILAIVNLGLIIPSSPGFIGTFQFFCILSLSLFGVSKGIALSFSVAYHISQFLPTTVVGAICLINEDFGLRWLATLSRKAQ